ncbi:MAG: hydrogenase maturation protease [Anaerolineales bacterium]
MSGSTLCLARLLFLMKTIVIGLGNPILGDDGIGWKVAEEVKKQLSSPSPRLRHRSPTRAEPDGEAGRGAGDEGDNVEVDFLSLGGLSLMEHLVGYERAILIDAIASDQAQGSVILSKLSEMPDFSALHTTSTHDTSLQNALKLGKSMGANLPEDVTVVGIVTNQVYDFSEELSPPVAEAIPKAAKIVMDLL